MNKDFGIFKRINRYGVEEYSIQPKDTYSLWWKSTYNEILIYESDSLEEITDKYIKEYDEYGHKRIN